MSKKYSALNLPKKHNLKYHMKLVGRLYGEPEESLEIYMREQLKYNEHNLDEAIVCFQSLIPEEERERLEREQRESHKAAAKK